MKARFQFFYSFRFDTDEVGLSRDGFDTHIPTRDVLNTHNEGYKTEPFLERHIENWCDCRPRQIKAAALEALAMSPSEPHYLILTTTHPMTKARLAVGFLQFDERRYHKLRKLPRFAGRENVYPGRVSETRLCSFEDAFQFHCRYTPGARYGIQIAGRNPDFPTAAEIISHMRSAENHILDFPRNVWILEKRLKQADRKAYQDYAKRLGALSIRCRRAS